MTGPVAPVAKLTRRVEDLELARITYRKHTVVAVSLATSTYDADVEGVGRVNGFTAPSHFLPKVGDEFNLPLQGSVPGFQPIRIAPGAVGEEELGPYVDDQISVVRDTANGKNKVTYSLVAPTTETGTTVGDPWFKRAADTGVVTGTWQWDGDSWEPATFGDEVLASLTVGKLVGGTGTFDLIVGGRLTTASTGQRTELNPLGLQGFNAAGDLTINLDGVDNLLTGRVRTGLTGRRVEVGVTDSSGEIRFFAADGTTQSFLRSYTDTASGQEGLQLGMPIAGAPATWNALYYNAQEWTSYQTKIHDFVYQDRWSVIQTTDRGAGAGKRRLFLDPNEFQFRGGYGTDETKSLVYKFEDGSLTGSFNSGAKFKFGDGFAGESSNLSLTAADNYGVILRATSTGVGAWFDVRNIFNNNYAGVRASEFQVNSDARGKLNITDAPIVGALAQVDAIRPRSYQRIGSGDRPVRDDNGDITAVPGGPVVDEIGVVAQEAPPFLVPEDAPELGVNLVRWLLLLTAAVQELNQREKTT